MNKQMTKQYIASTAEQLKSRIVNYRKEAHRCGQQTNLSTTICVQIYNNVVYFLEKNENNKYLITVYIGVFFSAAFFDSHGIPEI